MPEKGDASDKKGLNLSPILGLTSGLLVIAVLVAGSVCTLLGTSLLVIHQILDHSLILYLIGGIAVGFSLTALRSKEWLWAIAITYLAVTASFLVISSLLWPLPVEKQALPPPGKTSYQLIISGTNAGPDPVEILSIRQQRGLFSMEWDFACFNGDDLLDTLRSVTWQSPTQIRFVVGDRKVKTITVDETTGKPRGFVAFGNC